jgi:hypothetical protein
MDRRRHVAGSVVARSVAGVVATLALATPNLARAQANMSAPLTPGAADPQLTGPGGAPRPPVARPRFVAAIGMGASFDQTGFVNEDTHAVPAFFGTGAIGDGLGGFEFLGYASSGQGRWRADDAIDRLGLDLYGVVRPAARFRPDEAGYGQRVLRTLGAELGLGFERDGKTTSSGTRFVVHTGARLELPITPPGGSSELRARIGVRRDWGLYRPKIDGPTAGTVTTVGDTIAEIYAALVLVF